jgi:very-short-patch-repair endonuclease
MIDSLVEIQIKDQQDFLKIRETLTRIGIASRKDNKLYQSCHILHKQNKYYIVHFKELFALDGKQTDFSEDDKARRNTIINLLEQWDLLKVVNQNAIEQPRSALSQIKVIPFKEKANWDLVPKYNIGKPRPRQ